MSRQLAVPESDIFNGDTFPKQWLRQTDNGTSPLYELVDDTGYTEPVSNDAIYVNQGLVQGDSAICVLKLTAMEQPPAAPDQFGNAYPVTMVASRCYRTSGSAETSLSIELRQGYVDENNLGTLIHVMFDDGFTLTTTMTTREDHFDGSAVTDWTDLSLRLVTTADPLAPFVPGDGMRVGFVFFSATQPNTFNVIRRSQFPTRSIWRGELKVLGTVNGSPTIQLINVSTNRKIRVFELSVWGQSISGANTGQSRQPAYGIRRSDNPFDKGTGGSYTFGNMLRLSNDTEACAGVIRGIDFNDEETHNIIGQTGYEFEDIDDEDSDGLRPIFCPLIVVPSSFPSVQPFYARAPGSFHWTIMPLSAIEVVWLDNGTAKFSHAQFVFDQVPIHEV